MNAKSTFDEIEDAGAILAQLRELASQFESKYSFVSRITSPQDYSRAIAMLDELTGGRELGPNEEALLDELTSAINDYENTSEQFADFNSRWEKELTPIELLKALMETNNIKGHELPEIGDKTVVSKVLSGRRKISHKMAIALGQRFSMAPEAFLDDMAHEVERNLYGRQYMEALYLEDYIREPVVDKYRLITLLSAMPGYFDKAQERISKWETVYSPSDLIAEFEKKYPGVHFKQSHIINRASFREGTYITVIKKGDKQLIAPFRMLKTS